MIEPWEERNNNNTSAALIGFTLGAIAGAGLALLLAPDSGKKTREVLVDAARRSGKLAVDAIGQARTTVKDLGSDVKSAVEAGKESFAEVRAGR